MCTENYLIRFKSCLKTFSKLNIANALITLLIQTVCIIMCAHLSANVSVCCVTYTCVVCVICIC